MQQYEQLHYYGIRCDNLLSISFLELLDTLYFKVLFLVFASYATTENEGLKIAAKVKQITKSQKKIYG